MSVLTNILKSLLQPPGFQLLLLAIALLCWFRFRNFSLLLTFFSFFSLYLFSTGFVASALMRGLEYEVKPLSGISVSGAQAIVILGTGVRGNTPEYDMEPQPSALLAQRLFYGLKLAGDTELPILVSGGSSYGINEAVVMERFLQDHGSEVRWQESKSASTRENAKNTARILIPESITKILLVSHAWHLRRAQWVFKENGFDVVTAPTAYAGRKSKWKNLNAWLPDVQELRKSQLSLHEYVGLFWYKLGTASR